MITYIQEVLSNFYSLYSLYTNGQGFLETQYAELEEESFDLNLATFFISIFNTLLYCMNK